MKEWLKDKSDAIILIIGIPLALLIGAALGHFVVVPFVCPNDITTVVVSSEFTDIVAQSVKSVVHVRCPQWQGSGFIIDEHIICTARHVVDGVEDFTITFSDGEQVKASRAISDKKHDVGFI